MGNKKAKIQIVRGLKNSLPTLLQGELGYATDSNELFIGDPEDGNVLINTSKTINNEPYDDTEIKSTITDIEKALVEVNGSIEGVENSVTGISNSVEGISTKLESNITKTQELNNSVEGITNSITGVSNDVELIGNNLEYNIRKTEELISSYDKNMMEIKNRLFNKELNNRQYVFVGDSLRDSNGRFVIRKMSYKLATNGISPCLIAKSGLTAEHWSKTKITQNLNDFPTTDDVIKVIKGTGSECVVDICLCTNDLNKDESIVVEYLKKGINDILTSKPDTKFIITTPNRYNDTDVINNKAYNICKTVVDDLGNVAFSDVMNGVFRTREETLPYLLDTQHPSELGQTKIAEYKIKTLFDGTDALTSNINFNELSFSNTDGSTTIIRYAIDVSLLTGEKLHIKKDYQDKWCFGLVTSTSQYLTCSEIIGENGFHVLKQRFNKERPVYGLIEVENVEGLINNPSSTVVDLPFKDYTICSKIKYPLNTNTDTSSSGDAVIDSAAIISILNDIKFWDLKGEIDRTDALYKSLSDVSLKVGIYQTDGGAEPTGIYFRRVADDEYVLCDENNNALCTQYEMYDDGIYDLKAMSWDTFRATGKLKIRNFQKLRETLSTGEKVKLVNAQHYSPIVQKSIIELLDY